MILLCVVSTSGCGRVASEASAPTTTAVVLKPPVYAVVPPLLATRDTVVVGSIAGEQIHQVVAGDYLYLIAQVYCLDVDVVVAYNGWADGVQHNLHPGDQVRIPVGACVPV